MIIRPLLVACVATLLSVLFDASPLVNRQPAQAQSPSPAPGVSGPGSQAPSVLDLLVSTEWQGNGVKLAFRRTGQVVRQQGSQTEQGTFKLSDSRHLDISMSGQRYYLRIRHLSIRALHMQLVEQSGATGPARQYQPITGPPARSPWADVQYVDGQLQTVRDESAGLRQPTAKPADQAKPAASSPAATTARAPAQESNGPVPSVMDLLTGEPWRAADGTVKYFPNGKVVFTLSGAGHLEGTFKLVDTSRLEIDFPDSHYSLKIRHISTNTLRTQSQHGANAPVLEYSRVSIRSFDSRWAGVKYEDGRLVREARGRDSKNAATDSTGQRKLTEAEYGAAVFGAVLEGIIRGLPSDFFEQRERQREEEAERRARSDRESEELQEIVRRNRRDGLGR